jgi:protocatechuate 4,5-dioxygenase beta chain
MAKIIAGVATSHIPAVGAALDLGKSSEPYWQPVFQGYERAKEWFAQNKARRNYSDLQRSCISLFFGNDSNLRHLVVQQQFAPADEGWGPRPVPAVQGLS